MLTATKIGFAYKTTVEERTHIYRVIALSECRIDILCTVLASSYRKGKTIKSLRSSDAI